MSSTKVLVGFSLEQSGEAHLHCNQRADVLVEVRVQTKRKWHGVPADARVWAEMYVAELMLSTHVCNFDLQMKTEVASVTMQTQASRQATISCNGFINTTTQCKTT